MPLVRFTANIQRHVACPSTEVPGATLREVLDNVFAGNPRARAYVLDDQAGVRRHMAIFIDGALIKDRDHLSDPVRPDSRVDVYQSLTGG